MFTDCSSEIIGFSSRKPEIRNVSDSATETMEKNSSDKNIQSCSSENVFTQTVSPNKTLEYNETALAEYLTRICPLVLQELEMEVNFIEMDKDKLEENSVLSKLNEFKSPWGDSKVSKASWNSTGGTLAVGFGMVRHDSWCNHETQLLFHSVFSQKAKDARAIYTRSCVTTLQFHPIQPSLVIAGLYNGNILVVDLSKEEDRTTFNGPTEHTTSIVAIGWIAQPNANICYSADSDGQILQWKINLTSRTITVTDRYKITRSHQSVKVSEGNDGLKITTATKILENELIVGVADGGLLHCSLSLLQANNSHSSLIDPVVFTYQSHKIIVTSIREHPIDKLFASSSSDGQIRVYKPLKEEPRYIINTETCPLDIFWTESPAIIGTCGSSNTILFFRIATGKIHNLTLTISEEHSATVTEAMLQRNIVAIGNAVGNIEIWRISLSTN